MDWADREADALVALVTAAGGTIGVRDEVAARLRIIRREGRENGAETAARVVENLYALAGQPQRPAAKVIQIRDAMRPPR